MKYLENTMLTQLWDKIRRTFQTQTDNSLKTTSKTVIGAINELNGARKPIIITGDMTEVDEETYQKLLQEGTDVILNLEGVTFVELQGIFNTGDILILIFGYSQFDESNDGVIATYTITINTSAPHTLTLAVIGSCEPVSKSTLSPVLQEIDLTGTDAERKAKLDKFETDWKALTGASDLTGARFVGYYEGNSNSRDAVDLIISNLFVFNSNEGTYNGLGVDDYGIKRLVYLERSGEITCANIMEGAFSHLEAITIYTDNTPEHMQANLANIAAYEANLQALGVTNVDGIMIPIKFEDDPENIAITFPFSGYITKYSSFYDGIVSTLNGAYNPRVITINGQQGEDGGKVVFEAIALEKQLDIYTPKELNAKSLEAITIKTDNSTASKAANVAAIKAYVYNLKALGVDTTKGYMIPVKLDNGYQGFIMGTGANRKHTGVIKDDKHTYGGGWLFIDDIGTYALLSCLTTMAYGDLTTTAKTIVPAINEVNANAVHSDKLVPTLEAITIYIDNTPEHMQANLDNIAAYEANLQALGVDTTKGYMIPITASGRNGFLSSRAGNYPYAGYVSADSSVNDFYNILILGNGEYYDSKIQSEVSGELHTISKQIVGAINEINANAVHSDKLVPTLEAITIGDNTPEGKAATKAVIEAYRDNLIALGVDVTKGFMIPVKTNNGNGFIFFDGTKGDGYIKVNNDCYGISITANYSVAVNNLISTITNYSTLNTTSKRVLLAINEVNALAKSKQDALTSGTNIKTVNGQSLLGSGDIAISGGGSAPVLVDIDDISGSAGDSVPVDVFNTLANAAIDKTPIFGYTNSSTGSVSNYEIIPLTVKYLSNATVAKVMIDFILFNKHYSINLSKNADNTYTVVNRNTHSLATDTSVSNSSANGVQSSAVWTEIHSEPMTVNTATSGVTTLSSTDKHKILCYADSGTQQYNLPSSPVDCETFLFLKVKSGHTITIQSGTGNENIYDCSSGNSVVSKTIETSTKRKITVTYSSTVGKWFLMANDFLS